MKKIVSGIMLTLLLIGMFTFSLCGINLLELQIAYASPYTDISVDTAYNMITNSSYPDLIILDVRTQSEYDGGHIYRAVWIPVSELETRIAELAGHENHEIIVYCRSGGRSATASGILDSHNFTKVFNMVGGIMAWQSSGYPVWIATVHNVDTTLNYDTIRAAIDAPQTVDGHTIFVEEGTYYEHVVVNKSLSLIGESEETTIIDGNRTCSVIRIPSLYPAINVTISGFTIRNSGTSYDYAFPYSGDSGIWTNNVDGRDTFSDNILRNNLFGICGHSARGETITNNKVMNNTYGIYLGDSAHSFVANNTVTENIYGIVLQYGRESTIVNNLVMFNHYGFWLDRGGDNIVYHNSFIHDIWQIYVMGPGGRWDDGYPSGGNYWSDYVGRDLCSGQYQNLDGSDGIGDTAYVIDGQNRDCYPLMNPWTPPDIAVTNITAYFKLRTIIPYVYPPIIGWGYSICINVTIQNQGNKVEGFNLTAYANTTAIQTQYIVLKSDNSATITFTWNTAGVAKGNYTITAKATPLPYETDTTDNTLTDGCVVITIPGDINGDYRVDYKDLFILARVYGCTKGDVCYVPNADINGDNKVNYLDLYILAKHYGQKS